MRRAILAPHSSSHSLLVASPIFCIFSFVCEGNILYGQFRRGKAFRLNLGFRQGFASCAGRLEVCLGLRCANRLRFFQDLGRIFKFGFRTSGSSLGCFDLQLTCGLVRGVGRG